MPLGEKIWKLFRHSDKIDKNAISSVVLDVDDATTWPSSEAVTVRVPTRITEQDEYIVAATQASLQDEISRLEGLVRNQTNQLSRQEQGNRQAAQEINALKDRLTSVTVENATLRALAEDAQRRLDGIHDREVSLSQRLAAEEENTSQSQRENTALREDILALYERNQQFENAVPQVIAKFAEQDRKNRELELRLSCALQPMNSNALRAFEERSGWIFERDEMETRLETEKSQMRQEMDALSTHMHRVEDERENLKSTIAALLTGLEDEKAGHRDAKEIIQALQVSEQSMHQDFSQLQTLLTQLQSLFPNPTPRQVLFLVLSERRTTPAGQGGTIHSTFSRTHTFDDLSVEDLDTPLAESSFTTFLESLNPSSPPRTLHEINFMCCTECNIQKITAPFNQRLPGVQKQKLVEFPQRFAERYPCLSQICKDCLKTKVEVSIVKDWWYHLDSEQWLKCWKLGCDHTLDLRQAEDDFLPSEVAEVKTRFSYALAFRGELARVEPRMTPEAISTVIALFLQLEAFGLLNADAFNFLPNDQDTTPEDRVGEILIGTLDRDNLKIPIFTKFLRKAETSKECCICLESFHEIAIEDEQQWKQACDGYHGPWMSQVFSFPTRDILQCDEHAMHVCKECLQRHLESQLEQHGWNARDRLTCPVCNRALSESEIRSLGSAEAIQRYDNYLLLSHLSSDPNFRRCLRAGCEDGQIYEQDEYPNPHIVCASCDFEMCFPHQMPWHTGLSCDQFDSQREHGDPEYHQTQEWIQSNSKNCPGANCGVNIEKGNACFHMTCAQCRHEFCWECLADWSRINPQPGTYVKGAHKDGCWFKDSDVEPTQVSGTDLQGALRRRAGR